MLNQQYGHMEGFTAFPAAAFSALWLLWAFFRLPEMDGISTQILDKLFDADVPARRFPEQAARLQLGFNLSVGIDAETKGVDTPPESESSSETPSTTPSTHERLRELA